jgi:predicted TIM-barrel fold metal-dependent hydrolase
MKLTAILITALAFTTLTFAQVQIKPLPKSGYEQRIRNYIDQMRVVDTHEHLGDFSCFDKRDWFGYHCSTPDFMLLLFHYTSDDIQSAGMPEQEFKKLTNDGMTVLEKWQAIKPYWDATKNTAYSRAALLVANQLFGVKTIDSTTVGELSENIRKAYMNPNKWFSKVLIEKCRFDYVVQNIGWEYPTDSIYDPAIFRFVRGFNTWVGSKNDIETYAKNNGLAINALDDLVSAFSRDFQHALKKGIIGVKIGDAYNRILYYEDVKKEKAEAIFNQILNSSGEKNFQFSEIKPLQDYMTRRILDLANSNHIPVQIHTGLQAGYGNIIENSKPTHLVNLFQEYPDVKFILFHGSYPYGGELSTLAKNFRNVYIDMCWMYIISPSYGERYLNEWLETVPACKIMAFGGDFLNVEGTYGHLLLAKQIVSNVLISKVKDGYFTEAEAIKVAQMILHDNAIRILNLK